MKNHKINFFESPNPRHINFHNFTEYQCYLSDDNETPQNRLFSTPIKMNKNDNYGLLSPMDHFQTCPQMRCKRKTSEDIQGQLSHHQQNIEQQPLSCQGIKEIVSFSQNQEVEEMLMPITPTKDQHKRQPEQLEKTPKKQPNFHYTPATQLTPASQNRSAERGLKKLAAQAYRFVLHQKRTSYKQVAKKLIEELGDESELDVTKRGEMNIKRRVYDALNVLIALGLLRRNGNKIMSKRQQMEFVAQDLTYARQRQRRREVVMQEELASLKQALKRKEDLMNQKRKLQQDIKQKMSSLKDITEKNKSYREKTVPQDNKLQFPLFVLCYNKTSDQTHSKKEQSHSKISSQMVDEKQQQNLKIWQNTANNVLFSFNKHKSVQILGEFDVLGLGRNEWKKEKALKIQKIKRRR